jgi:hypothetical protein
MYKLANSKSKIPTLVFTEKILFLTQILADYTQIAADNDFPALIHSATNPNVSQLGKESRKPEGLIKAEGLSLSVSTLSMPQIEYSKQTSMQANRGIRMC